MSPLIISSHWTNQILLPQFTLNFSQHDCLIGFKLGLTSSSLRLAASSSRLRLSKVAEGLRDDDIDIDRNGVGDWE